MFKFCSKNNKLKYYLCIIIGMVLGIFFTGLIVSILLEIVC